MNQRKLGLIGHSEGGVITPMLAARNSAVSFILMMAGPGVRGDEIIPAKVAAILEAGGASKQEAERARPLSVNYCFCRSTTKTIR